ncbi:MAG: GNAT family N-acetyltransferase [Bdellovibrionota bacterium]
MQLELFKFKQEEITELNLLAKNWNFWNCKDILKILRQSSYYLYYIHDCTDDHWQGLIFFQKNDSFTDLLFIYVTPSNRKKGVGESLLNSLMDLLKKDPMQKNLFLEVRLSNKAAQALYEKIGMKKNRIKKSYYSNQEDAIIYQKNL